MITGCHAERLVGSAGTAFREWCQGLVIVLATYGCSTHEVAEQDLSLDAQCTAIALALHEYQSHFGELPQIVDDSGHSWRTTLSVATLQWSPDRAWDPDQAIEGDGVPSVFHARSAGCYVDGMTAALAVVDTDGTWAASHAAEVMRAETGAHPLVVVVDCPHVIPWSEPVDITLVASSEAVGAARGDTVGVNAVVYSDFSTRTFTPSTRVRGVIQRSQQDPN
jgi:hypothetical protein